MSTQHKTGTVLSPLTVHQGPRRFITLPRHSVIVFRHESDLLERGKHLIVVRTTDGDLLSGFADAKCIDTALTDLADAVIDLMIASGVDLTTLKTRLRERGAECDF